MALQFNGYGADPGDKIRERWSGALDSVINEYYRAKQSAQQSQVLQSQMQTAQLQQVAAQQQIAAGQRTSAMSDIQDTAQFGAPLSSYNPRDIQQAGEQAQPSFNGPVNPKFAGIVKGLHEISNKRDSAISAEQAKLENTQADTKYKEAEAWAKLHPNSGVAYETVNIKGVDFIKTSGPNGQIHLSPIPERQPSQNEYVARGYADKAQEAESALSTLISNGYKPTTGGAIAGAVLPDAFQSQDLKAFENAKRMFANSIARRESGATIKDDEMARYNLMYFPSANDGPEILRQKAENRRIAIQNLASEGKRAPSALGGKNTASGGLTPEEQAELNALEKRFGGK